MLVEDSEIELNENKYIEYLDYDIETKIVYTNFFFPEVNHVLKIPIASLNEKIVSNEIKFEKFTLLKYKCLAFYKTLSISHHE